MCHVGRLWYISGVGRQGMNYVYSCCRQRSTLVQSLWAYHIEALVPSGPPRHNLNRTPQKLNNHKDVQFFSVGTMNSRTLLIYMKKKGVRRTEQFPQRHFVYFVIRPKAYFMFWNLSAERLLTSLRHLRRLVGICLVHSDPTGSDIIVYVHTSLTLV